MVEFFAYYSKIQENIIKQTCYHNKKKGVNNYTNIYKLKNSDKLVEVTTILDVKNNDNPYRFEKESAFEDMKYLGIVDKWIKVGKYI